MDMMDFLKREITILDGLGKRCVWNELGVGGYDKKHIV